MNVKKNIKTMVCWISSIEILVLCAGCSTSPEGRPGIQSVGRSPNIQPDYSGIVIPSNIAPLNFIVKEAGEEYIVRIHSKQGDPIRIQSGSNCIQIPQGQWNRLLAENPGQQLIIDILLKNQTGQWIRFDSIVNQIACETIDRYVTYRKFDPLFNFWGKMGIYQRNLESFNEKPVFINRLTTPGNCMNCHNFWQNGTDRWLLHLRFGPGTSMLLKINGELRKIDTRTGFNKSPAGYPGWHPSGELIAFSVGKPLQFFHTIGETRDELDASLDIILYDIPTNTVTTIPQLSSPDRIEVWPTWSTDGRYLYFCSAPKLETFLVPSKTGEDSLAYDKIKYDLMRIAYDPDNHTWGKLENVISSTETKLSITQPRISPDGRFLVFTMSKYSSFPIFHSEADLYLLDLSNGVRKKLELNSERAEGYHSWSSNSRWIVFSSKREDGQFTRLYLSYIDSLGNASKSFILPQENPFFYDTYLEIYNVPEFSKEPIKESPQVLAEAAFSKPLAAKLDSNVILRMTSKK